MARKTADLKKLVGTVNEEYLTHSALLIGSAYALRGPRIAAERERRLESQQTMHRVKTKLKAINAMNRKVQSFVAEESIRQHKQKASNENEEMDDHGLEEADGDQCFPICASWFNKNLERLQNKLWSCYRKFFGSQTAPP
jgi:hypothetical protein